MSIPTPYLGLTAIRNAKRLNKLFKVLAKVPSILTSNSYIGATSK